MNYQGLIEHMRKSAPFVQDSIIEDWIHSAIETISADLDIYEDFATPALRAQRIERDVLWHIRRLNGFGGSDMSVLYTEYKGGFTTYGGDETIDAASVVAGKLALVGVSGSNGDMQRGKVMEKEAEASFLREMRMKGLILKPHPTAIKQLKEFQEKGWEEHPWCYSSPDGVYIDQHGKSWLVDFKVPSDPDNAVAYYRDPPLHYRAQLAQYKAHLQAAGVEIDNVALVPFSTKMWRSYVGDFSITQDFINEILECGDYYWEFVKNGELPRRPPSKDFQFIEELPAELKGVMAEFIMASKMKSVSDKRQKQLKTTILELASLHGVDWMSDGRKTRLPGVDISHSDGKRKINTDALKSRYEKLGGDLEDPDLYTTTSSTTVGVVRGKKVAFIDFIVDNQDVAETMFQDAIAEIKETQDFVKGGIDEVYEPTVLEEPVPVIEEPSVAQAPVKNRDAAFDELGF